MDPPIHLCLMHKGDAYKLLTTIISAISFYLKLLVTTFLAISFLMSSLQWPLINFPMFFFLAGQCYIYEGIIAFGQIDPVVLCVEQVTCSFCLIHTLVRIKVTLLWPAHTHTRTHAQTYVYHYVCQCAESSMFCRRVQQQRGWVGFGFCYENIRKLNAVVRGYMCICKINETV